MTEPKARKWDRLFFSLKYASCGASGQKHVKDVDGWLLRCGEEAPGISAAGIRDKASGIAFVVR
jgi:hypothetical protein